MPTISACLVMGQIVFTRDHRPALSKPALPSATSKKIVLHRQLSDLGMERLHIDRRRIRSGARHSAEHPGSPFLKLRLPLRHLVGVNVEVLRQLSQRVLAPLSARSRASMRAKPQQHLHIASRYQQISSERERA
jgi:hypothetical protein